MIASQPPMDRKTVIPAASSPIVSERKARKNRTWMRTVEMLDRSVLSSNIPEKIVQVKKKRPNKLGEAALAIPKKGTKMAPNVIRNPPYAVYRVALLLSP